MTEPTDIAIIGAGRVGTALGVLAGGSGYRVVAVADAKADAAEICAKAIGPSARVRSAAQAAGAGQIVLLTVNDDAIEGLCNELAGANAFGEGAVVAHCSGVLDSGVLASARRCCRCAVGSMHPLQTFPSAEAAVAKLPAAMFFCEGDERAVAALRRLVEAVGGTFVQIDAAHKALYHAAATMACNDLAALLDAAATLCEDAGIGRDTSLPAMEPLVRATVDNVFAAGPAEALTGPIARGDVETVRRHLAALADCKPDLRTFYRAAAVWTCELAGRKADADITAIDEIRKLLGGSG